MFSIIFTIIHQIHLNQKLLYIKCHSFDHLELKNLKLDKMFIEFCGSFMFLVLHSELPLYHTLSLASSITTEFPRTTTIPIECLLPSFRNSVVSSITRFMNGSNPLKTPSTCRLPLIFKWI